MVAALGKELVLQLVMRAEDNGGCLFKRLLAGPVREVPRYVSGGGKRVVVHFPQGDTARSGNRLWRSAQTGGYIAIA